MSDVNLDFTVSNNSINFTVQPNDITITPTDIQLTIAQGGITAPGAPLNSVQYNKDSQFTGTSTFSYIEGTETLGVQNLVLNATAYIHNANMLNIDVANLHVTGGINGYVLQTDGVGNLNWTLMSGNGGGGNGTPGGANTQIQYNDSGAFGGNTGFTFNEVNGNVNIPGNLSVAGNIIGNVQNAYLANYATISNSVAGGNVSGQVNYAAVANSVAGANVSGQVNYAAVANSVAVANVSGIGNIATVNLTGSTSNVLYGNGIFAAIAAVSTANFANYAGNITVSAQPNITSLGNLTTLTLGYRNIALGDNARAGNDSVSIGAYTNYTAGNAGPYAIRTVTLGDSAGGGNYRGNYSVAVGFSAGGANLGENSIAIGKWAAINGNGITTNNYIILNASGANLDPVASNSFVVKPIRSAATANILYYNNSTGEITYQTGGNSTTPPAGSNTQVQFNNSNSFGASANFTFNTATNNLVIGGNISATGNIITSGVVTATGNVTGGNIRTVNGYVESQNGNIYANNGYIVGGEGVFTNLRFVSNISSNASASPVGVSVATHKFPIVLNGTTYYILLTT